MVENLIQYEVELVERLWSQGWAAFRTASSGPGALAQADVIALKRGNIAVLNVEAFESGTSTAKVGDTNDDLIKIKRRADELGMCGDNAIIIGHAIYKIYEDRWCYGDIGTHKLKASSSYQDLNSVVHE